MPLLDYAELRRQVSMERVLSLVGFVPTRRRGDQLRGACPLTAFHAKDARIDRRCFSVHLGGHVFHCFGCGRSGNQLDLWRFWTGVGLYPAALALCAQTGIDPPCLS